MVLADLARLGISIDIGILMELLFSGQGGVARP
jgi:hypothetical protein